MFGRHPKTPMEMEESSENSVDMPEIPSNDELDRMVSLRENMLKEVQKEVQKNVEKAQAKQKKDYAKRKEKGVKVFNHEIGDIVLRKVMKNSGRKGGKMDALWTGPYRIAEIDNHQRIQLEIIETGEQLKVKMPYDQMRPHKTSELHKTKPVSAQPTLIKPVEIKPATDQPSLTKFVENQSTPSEPVQKQTTLIKPVENQPTTTKPVKNQPITTKPAKTLPTTTKSVLNQPTATTVAQNQFPKPSLKPVPTTPLPANTKYNDDIVVGEIKKGKRKAVQLAVKSAVPKKNIAGLVPVIQSGKWLEDEQIDHAQAMLAKQFTSIGGLQPVCIFEPQGCQRVGTPENALVQILNVNDNHWITMSNIGCPKDTAVIYDSLHHDINSYDDKLLRQMAYMLMPRSRHMTLFTADMEKQVGTSDCGLFAIAAVTSLCLGLLPQNCKWKQEKMREHLIRCFEGGVLKEFPKLSKTRDHQCYLESKEVQVFLPLSTAICRNSVHGTVR